MAEKRMLSKKVLDTDAFLDMPLSAQAETPSESEIISVRLKAIWICSLKKGSSSC